MDLVINEEVLPVLASKALDNVYTIARGGYMANVTPVFRAIVRPCEDVGGYWSAVDMDNGGCTVQGDTVQETQTLMRESIAFYLEDYPDIKDFRLDFEFRNA